MAFPNNTIIPGNKINVFSSYSCWVLWFTLFMPHTFTQSVYNETWQHSLWLFSTTDLAKRQRELNSYIFPGKISPCCLIVFTGEGGLMLYINGSVLQTVRNWCNLTWTKQNQYALNSCINTHGLQTQIEVWVWGIPLNFLCPCCPQIEIPSVLSILGTRMISENKQIAIQRILIQRVYWYLARNNGNIVKGGKVHGFHTNVCFS